MPEIITLGPENVHRHFNLLALILTHFHYLRNSGLGLLILRERDWSEEGWIRCREEVQFGFDARI